MENFASLKKENTGKYKFDSYDHDGYTTWYFAPNEYLSLEVEFTPSRHRIQGEKAYRAYISKPNGVVRPIATTSSFDTFEEAEEALESLVEDFVKGL